MAENLPSKRSDTPEPKKLLERNIVWFAIGMVAMGAIGAVTFLGFLDQRIDDRITNTPDLITKVAARLAQDHADDLRRPPPTDEDMRTAVQAAMGDQVASRSGLPVGVVIASLQECAALEPQQTWKPFREGIGRFIIGAGNDPHPDFKKWERESDKEKIDLSPYKLLDASGEEKHTLIEDEMPSHSHSGKVGEPDLGAGMLNQDKDRFSDHNAGAQDIGATGDNQPHNNMPPYIALYFCKYEGTG